MTEFRMLGHLIAWTAGLVLAVTHLDFWQQEHWIILPTLAGALVAGVALQFRTWDIAIALSSFPVHVCVIALGREHPHLPILSTSGGIVAALCVLLTGKLEHRPSKAGTIGVAVALAAAVALRGIFSLTGSTVAMGLVSTISFLFVVFGCRKLRGGSLLWLSSWIAFMAIRDGVVVRHLENHHGLATYAEAVLDGASETQRMLLVMLPAWIAVSFFSLFADTRAVHPSNKR